MCFIFLTFPHEFTEPDHMLTESDERTVRDSFFFVFFTPNLNMFDVINNIFIPY